MTNNAVETRELINRAIRFAVEAHGPFSRKGTLEEPYITHPLEVMGIMNNMGLITTDPNLVVAGILHDVAEDTGVTLEDIRQSFGDDVEKLVRSHTENKDLTWEERKRELIDSLEEADDRVKVLILADALANLRSLRRDVRRCGVDLWKRFNQPKEKQCWYYNSVIEAVKVLATYEYSKLMFQEAKFLLEEVFED